MIKLKSLAALGATLTIVGSAHMVRATPADVPFEPADTSSTVVIDIGTPPVLSTGIPCQEDDPCWDCATMGNLICGPTLAPFPAAPPEAGLPETR